MRLRIPIRHDERIGNIATDETLPSVILPGPVPLEMRSDAHSTAPFTCHRNLLEGSEYICVTTNILPMMHERFLFPVMLLVIFTA